MNSEGKSWVKVVTIQKVEWSCTTRPNLAMPANAAGLIWIWYLPTNQKMRKRNLPKKFSILYLNFKNSLDYSIFIFLLHFVEKIQFATSLFFSLIERRTKNNKKPQFFFFFPFFPILYHLTSFEYPFKCLEIVVSIQSRYLGTRGKCTSIFFLLGSASRY